MQDKIKAALSSVKYPGFDQDIVTLGLAEQFSVDGKNVIVKMKALHAPDDVKEAVTKNIEDALVTLNLSVKVEFPDVPPVGQPGQQGQGGQQQGQQQGPPPKQEIAGVAKVIPVASGKGGVGKSTVAVNLAISLAKAGKKVGLLDLDVYGPSIPIMLNIDGPIPASDNQRLIPPEKYGIKVVSIGFLMEKGKALIWRGPMAGKIVKQFFYDVEWGELDYLVLDMPPGTGDVQLTLAQSLPTFGAVVVTTPQDVALADVEKAINMFDQTETKVLGIVENMSGYLCPHCNHESQIFGSGGGKRESDKRGVPLLAQIPLEPSITNQGDMGEPVALTDGKVANIFKALAEKIINIQ